MPLTAAASASDAKAPCSVRYATNAAAFRGPRPGSAVNSSAVAVLMSISSGSGAGFCAAVTGA